MQTMNERAGLICATIANVNRDPKKHAPYQPSDFVNCGEKAQPKKFTPQAIYDKMRMWCSALGGK